MSLSDDIFRIIFTLSAIVMTAVRLYYQTRVFSDREERSVRESKPHLIFGGFAAITAIFFGLAYIFFPSAFPWSYIELPDWLRWIGALMLTIGIGLFWSAHHHLGKNFFSLIATREDQVLVETGPYKYIRHPIYTAYVLNYIGGGLLASSWVLLFLPAPLFMLMIYFRVGEEERTMVEIFGEPYEAYMRRTGRFLPKISY